MRGSVNARTWSPRRTQAAAIPGAGTLLSDTDGKPTDGHPARKGRSSPARIELNKHSARALQGHDELWLGSHGAK